MDARHEIALAKWRAAAPARPEKLSLFTLWTYWRAKFVHGAERPESEQEYFDRQY